MQNETTQTENNSNKLNLQKKIINFLKSNWLLIIVIGFFLWQKIPVWLNEYGQTGHKLGSFELLTLDDQSISTAQLSFPRVFVFWATWCGPCKIEMGRLQSAVDKGELDPTHITAISFDEDNDTLRKSINEHKYTFQFLKDTHGSFARALQVRGTPTVIHIDSGENIVWMNTGLSLLGVQKAESLLKK